MSAVTESSSSFLRAARAGNLDKLLEFLKGKMDINTSNANGLNALHLASKEGHVHVVKELLSRGAAVDAATKKGNTALHIASLAGQTEVVEILVEHSAKVNVQSQNGFTPLYMAAQENHSEVVKFLLANGANQTLSTEDGFTPLAVALQQGHDRVVAVLLENDSRGKVRLPALHIAAKKDDVKATTLLLQNEHNADVNKTGGLVNDTTKSGFTPLHIACHYGNINVGRLLIDKGADVNYKARNSITPLHVASKWGRSNMVELLLDAKANIDARTRDGLTPLHCAARSGHDQVVDLLLERGALVTCKTKNGLTPLHMSSQGDHLDCARLLLYHKAPIDEVTVDYLTPLHVVAHCGNVKTAKLLLDRKCEVNARALNGFTPLHIACKKNRIKIVELLLKYGASLEATTESGLTPLHVASFMGHMNIVIYLIQHGSNPNNTTMRGETALHLAARANQTDIIRILLRNEAQVDHAKAREQQTALHISSRLGNVDNVLLLLQHGASPDAVTKDFYTPLHIAAKEGHDEVVQVLLEHGAKQTVTTKRGFTPLHVAAKYGNLKVVQMLIQRGTNPNLEGKNGLTPLHVATHYNRVNVALHLLEKNATPHAATKNGYTPLHIAAKKNQMDIATTLLEHGSNADAESRNGFTPLHLAAQEGHSDMVALLTERGASVNCTAKNGLTPLHLTAQEDHVPVAEVLVDHKANIDPQTKAGYTPLHTACHFGQIGMIRFLLDHGASVNSTTKSGYTPLHQAAQQGHVLVINLLLKYRASPNSVTTTGQTPLSIAQRLGYISVVEILKHITDVTVPPSAMEEKYKVMFPETMQEAPMSDSEEEGGEESLMIDQSFQYLTSAEKPADDNTATQESKETFTFDQMSEKGSMTSLLGQGGFIEDAKYTKEAGVMPSDFKGIKDDNMIMSFSECSQTSIKAEMIRSTDLAPYQYTSQELPSSMTNQYDEGDYYQYASSFSGVSNAHSYETSQDFSSDLSAAHSGFLVSFLVDARGGAMRGCRHSGVRIIIPPEKACMPTRVTCRLIKKEKVTHPPALMEGEALASRILEMGPVGAKFNGPVIIEVPHFASLRGKEREITVLRSENGQTWREHTVPATEEAVRDALQGTIFSDLESSDDLLQKRITRILTSDFPQYFAVVARVRQEMSTIGPDGGMISSTVVPRVQAIFPEGSLTKNIKVGLQVLPVPSELVSKMLGNRVAVSPIVTVEPRRRKFHKPITLTIPAPMAAQRGMLNQYGGETPTLRLLCSIMGGTSPAQWEDITGTTPLTFINDCVSFTTTVSARFWLMDCQNVSESAKMASDLYHEIILVPFMSKFVVYAKRHDPMEARLRVFCMTDDKMDKLLENREQFKHVARSVDVEVLEGKPQYIEMGGNIVPVTKSGEKLCVGFHAFRENRLPFVVRVRDISHEASGLLAFMRDPRGTRSEVVQVPICTLTINLPDYEPTEPPAELEELEMKYDSIKKRPAEEQISKAELWLTDIADSLGPDWIKLARQMKVDESDINKIEEQYTDDSEKALVVLHLWIRKFGERATGNELEKVLQLIGHEDIVQKCMYNIEEVTDAVEKVVARVYLDSTGFDALREELGSSQDSSVPCGGISLDVSYEEQDILKESESMADESTTPIDGSNIDDGYTITATASRLEDMLITKVEHSNEECVDDRLTSVDNRDDSRTATRCSDSEAEKWNKTEMIDVATNTICDCKNMLKKIKDLDKTFMEQFEDCWDLPIARNWGIPLSGEFQGNDSEVTKGRLLDSIKECISVGYGKTYGKPPDEFNKGTNFSSLPLFRHSCYDMEKEPKLEELNSILGGFSEPDLSAFECKSKCLYFCSYMHQDFVREHPSLLSAATEVDLKKKKHLRDIMLPFSASESYHGAWIIDKVLENCAPRKCPDTGDPDVSSGDGSPGQGGSGERNTGNDNSSLGNSGNENPGAGNPGGNGGGSGSGNPGDGGSGGGTGETGGIRTREEVSQDEQTRPDGTVVKTKTIKKIYFYLSTDGAEEIVRIEITEEVSEIGPGVVEPFGKNVVSEKTTESSEHQMPNGVPVKKTVTKTCFRLTGDAHGEAPVKVGESGGEIVLEITDTASNEQKKEISSINIEISDSGGAEKIVPHETVVTQGEVTLGATGNVVQGVTLPQDSPGLSTTNVIEKGNVFNQGSERVEVKTEVKEDTKMLDNGTTVKTKTVTKTHVKEKFSSDGKPVQEINRVEIEEFVTEMAAGVFEPFGDDVEVETTKDTSEFQRQDGAAVTKHVVKTVAKRKQQINNRNIVTDGSHVLGNNPKPFNEPVTVSLSATSEAQDSKMGQSSPRSVEDQGNIEVRSEVTEDESMLADGTIVRKTTTTRTSVKVFANTSVNVQGKLKPREEIVETEIEERIVQTGPGISEPFGDNIETESSTESFRYYLDNGSPVVKTVVMIIAHRPLNVSINGSASLRPAQTYTMPPSSSVDKNEKNKLITASLGGGISSDRKPGGTIFNGIFNGNAPMTHPDVTKHLTGVTVKKNILCKKVRNVMADGTIKEEIHSFDDDSFSDTSSVSDIRDLSPFAFSSTMDDLFLDEYDPGSLAIQVCTRTEDDDPTIEKDTKEYEDVLPDGTIVHRTVTKSIERKSFVNHVVIHVPHASKSINGDLALENYVEPYLAKYSHHCCGVPEVTTDVQEFEDVLPDGKISKKRIMRKTEQQLAMERTLLIGNMKSECGPGEAPAKVVTSTVSNIPAFSAKGQDQGQGKPETSLVATNQEVVRLEDDQQVSRVVLRKQIHKKTIVADGKEETVVTEDTKIEQDSNTPQEFTEAIQELVQQFLDSANEPGASEGTEID